MSRLFRDVGGARLSARGTVVCIGAFDGLHLGHRALIDRALTRAREMSLEACVLSFEPLPREYFAPPGAKPPRLTWPHQKIGALAASGVDLIGLLRFDRKLASMSAEDFVRQVLGARLGAREVWTGEDFRFGRGRSGDAALLARLGAQLGFDSHTLAPVRVDGARVSSSRIRELLGAGRLDEAATLLGRRYTMGGRVVHGSRLGRKLGYPTANISLHGRTPALSGIFAARVHGVGDAPWPAVVSLGTRPTVDGQAPLLEAHLFGFDGDLYGRRLAVEFVAHLREEERFPDLESLVAQMHRDAAQARAELGLGRTQRGAAA